MKMNCHHADTCLSDYWSGHHLPHVMIPVTRRKMSFAEIRRAIRSEIAQGAVMGSGDDARLLSADMVRPEEEEEEKRADALTAAAYAAINRDVKGACKGQRYVDTGVEMTDDEHADMVCMYFVFTAEE